MKRNPRSPVTEMLLSKYKIWLIVGLTAMAVADIAACIWLWTFGAYVQYYIVPLLLGIASGLFIMFAVFSNMRFKYARNTFIVFFVAGAAAFAAWMITTLTSETVFTSVMMWLTFALHAVGLIAALVTYLFAARCVRCGETVQTVVPVAAAAVCAIVCVVYVVLMICGGCFGQGGTRPLTYEITNDGAVVTGVAGKRGDEIVVPHEFDGHKVSTVSAEVFRAPGVKRVKLECDPDVDFRDVNKLNTAHGSIEIYAKRNNVDAFKRKLYDLYESGVYKALDMANRLRPADMGGDVFVTFSYDPESYAYVDGNVLSTWFGRRGDVFEISDGEIAEYTKHTDIRSDADLVWSYNFGGSIMNPLVSNGVNIIGMPIDKSCKEVPIDFQKIYKILPGAGNDGKCDTSKLFDYTMSGENKLDYKLTVASTADELMTPFEREGFSLVWSREVNGLRYPLTSLTEYLENGAAADTVIIDPLWTLNKPEVRLVPSGINEGAVTYGDKFGFTAEVTHDLGEKLRYKYKWSAPGASGNASITAGTDVFDISAAQPNDTGVYSLTVTAMSDSVTTLTAQNVATATVKVDKRALSIEWQDPADSVYDGKQKTVAATIVGALEYDNVALKKSVFAHSDAGYYSDRVELLEAFADRYEIVSGASHDLTILPRTVDVVWSNDSPVYNGNTQMPTATAAGVNGDNLELSVSGSRRDAGRTTASVTALSVNYVVSDSTKTHEFVILPMPINVVWENTEFTYNGGEQLPNASATGVNGERVMLAVSGGQTDVGENYTATATCTDGNYEISSGAAQRFSITPKSVQVVWSKPNLVYNGAEQAPRAAAQGIGTYMVPISLSGVGTNAGTYTVTATSGDENYTLKGETERTYTISPREANVVWSSERLVYNGREQAPSVKVTGVNGAAIASTVTGAGKNAGNYEAAVSISDGNYTISYADATKKFTIEKKNVTVVINPVTIEYGQPLPAFTGGVQGFIPGDECEIEYYIDQENDENGFIPVGIYDIMIRNPEGGNYTFTAFGGRLTVKPAEQS